MDERKPRGLQALAKEALALQDACNPAAVAGSLQQIIVDLRRRNGGSMLDASRHPVARVVLDKLMDMMGAEARLAHSDWMSVAKIADGEITNIEKLGDAVHEGGE